MKVRGGKEREWEREGKERGKARDEGKLARRGGDKVRGMNQGGRGQGDS